MTRLPRIFLACLMALLPLKASAQSAAATQWWADVSALADDGMEGRLTGSPGYDRAAAYVIARLKAEGLEPAGIDGFLQPMAFEQQVGGPGQKPGHTDSEGRRNPAQGRRPDA